MTRASFTAPGANRSITFSDGKGRKNFCINKENGKIFSFSFHFPLIFLKKCTHTPVILFHTAPKQPKVFPHYIILWVHLKPANPLSFSS